MKLKVKKHRRWKRIDKWIQTAIVAISIIVCADLLSGQTITTLTLGILKLGNNATIISGQLLLPDGVATAPSLSFTTESGTGFARLAPNYISLSMSGVGVYAFTSSQFYVPSNITLGGDGFLVRDAPNTLALRNGNTDQTQRWYGANGAYFQVATQSELLTIGAGASTNTAMTIPANSIVRGVAVYVVTVIPVAANFTVTGTAAGGPFNTAAVSTAAGSNDVGTQNTPYKNGAAQTITITPNLPPLAATGQVRIVLMYEIPSAPTS
jgi:hypothetical protein